LISEIDGLRRPFPRYAMWLALMPVAGGKVSLGHSGPVASFFNNGTECSFGHRAIFLDAANCGY
jgi:hypothetical protein